MASKARKRKQSNLCLLDEPIQHPSDTCTRTQVGRRVYSGVVPNQAHFSQHEELTKQTTSDFANGSNQTQKGRSNHEQRVEAEQTRTHKQSNFSLNSEPSRLPPNKSTRTQVGRRVYNGVVPNQAPISQHEELTRQITTDFANGSNRIQKGRSSHEQRVEDEQTRTHKQSNFSLTSESSRPPPNESTRTRVDRRAHNGVADSQQVFNQIVHDRYSQANLELNKNICSIHNQMVVNQTRNSQHEVLSQNTCDHTNGSNEVENVQISDEEREIKKTRGPTYMLEIWGRPSTLPLIKVDFDCYGRPIGAKKSKFTEFLGTIARNGKYCPLDVLDWHKMPAECKTEMLNIVKARFDVTLADEEWILHSINSKWKSWKGYLKARYFVPNMPVSYLIDEKDERVLEDQWVNMLTHWSKEDIQAQSEQKKDARANKDMDHLTGKKSFAQVFDRLENEKGRAPSRAEMFEECYVPTNGTTSKQVSSYLGAMKELRNKLPEGSQDSVGQNDTFAQATRQDRPGYVRMFGGISPSNVWGKIPNRNSYKRMVLEQRAEMMEIKKHIAELQSQASLQQPQGLRSLSSSLSNPALTKQALQVGSFVSLKSLFDPTKIVAKGCLHSVDPNAEVGKQVLGENWCQIHIKVVLQPEEQLIRPYDYCQTLEDALGEMVAWPSHLVTVTGHC